MRRRGRERRREAGGAVRLVVMLLGGVGLFSAGLVGTLAVRGRLDALTGREQALDASPAGETESDAATGGASDAPTDHPEGEATSDTRASAHEAESVSSSSPGSSVLPPIALPSPFSSEETQRLFRDLKKTRDELTMSLDRVRREQRDLELVRAELNRRWDELTRREQDVEEKAKALAAEREELNRRMVLLDEAERDNLKALAQDIEKMKAESAAALLQEKPAERAALILSFVKPREAAKILSAMPTDFAHEVTEKRLQIVDPDKVGGDVGGAGGS